VQSSRQRSLNIEAYFKKCLIQVGTISDSEKHDRFVDGLKADVKKLIYSRSQEAQALALKVKRRGKGPVKKNYSRR